MMLIYLRKVAESVLNLGIPYFPLLQALDAPAVSGKTISIISEKGRTYPDFSVAPWDMFGF